MQYTMVPVPDDILAEVTHAIVLLTSCAAMTPWSPGTLAQLLADLDEAGEGVIMAVAAGTLDGKGIADAEVAANLHLELAEVHSVVREVNDWARARKREGPIAVGTSPDAARPERQWFSMRCSIAEMVNGGRRPEREGVAGAPAGEGP